MAPRLPTPQRDAWIGIRTTTAMREAWEAAAMTDGRTLTSWVIARCNGLPSTAPVLTPAAPAAPKPPPKRKRTRKPA